MRHFLHFCFAVTVSFLISWLFSALPGSLANTAEARPVIYQLVVRHFGNTNSTNAFSGTLEQNGSGKFNDITDRALREIRALGVTHVWLTGVLQQATTTDYSEIGQPADDFDIVKGRAGSFFAVRDYFDVCPDYAENPANRLEEFRALVGRIHSAGLKVMLDLVPNHVARSYSSDLRPEWNLGQNDDQSAAFRLQNNFVYLGGNTGAALEVPSLETGWYLEGMDGRFGPEDGQPGRAVKATGNRVLSARPSPNDWFETVILNYGFDFVRNQNLFQPGQEPANSTWEFMDEVVRYWTTEFLVDGFRADFAHWVPSEFWQWLIRRAQERRPGLYFLAEAYQDQTDLLAAGFDAVYDDESYDTLKGIQNQTSTLRDWGRRLLKIGDSERNGLLRYLENHDERRFASPIVYGSVPDKSGFGTMEDVRIFGPLQYLVTGGPILIYNGQTVGEPGEGVEGFDGENGKTSIFDYWQPPSLARWVNGGEFGFDRLNPEEIGLNRYYSDLLRFAQSDDFLSNRFYLLDFVWGQQMPKGTTAFARFRGSSGRLAVVVANFERRDLSFQVKLPSELVYDYARIQPSARVVLEFGKNGVDGRRIQDSVSADSLIRDGLRVSLPARSAVVYSIDSSQF